MESADYIKASPQALATFYYRCNTERDFRMRFLANPIKMLEEFDIIVGDDAKAEIVGKVKWLKEKLGQEIGIVPDWGEYGAELLENGWGIRINPTKDPAVIP